MTEAAQAPFKGPFRIIEGYEGPSGAEVQAADGYIVSALISPHKAQWLCDTLNAATRPAPTPVGDDLVETAGKALYMHERKTMATEAAANMPWEALPPFARGLWRNKARAVIDAIPTTPPIPARATAPAGHVLTEQEKEVAVGGAYEMPDGRKFWNDAPVAREIARRVMEAMRKK